MKTSSIVIIVLSIAAVIGIYLMLPVPAESASRSITPTSLNQAYVAKIAAINLEIASTTQALEKMKVQNKGIKVGEINIHPSITLKEHLNLLNRELEITRVSYELIEASLK